MTQPKAFKSWPIMKFNQFILNVRPDWRAIAPADNIKAAPQQMNLKKRVFKFSRIIHVYLSMALLALLVFFCLTGIFLNHSDWFSNHYTDKSVVLVVPEDIQNALKNSVSLHRLPLNDIQAYLNKKYHLTHLNQVNVDEEMGEVVLDYQMPAGFVTVYLNVDGSGTLDLRKGSIVTIMNDLHKGRHSGVIWSWVIDISAVLMLIFSISGLVILLQNRKYRRVGLWLSGLGILTPLLIYWFWVPYLAEL